MARRVLTREVLACPIFPRPGLARSVFPRRVLLFRLQFPPFSLVEFTTPIIKSNVGNTTFENFLHHTIFKVLGTQLDISTADHLQTDGQTIGLNRVIGETLRSFCGETSKRWSSMLPVIDSAINSTVHAFTGCTGCTPFYVKGLPHPRVPLTLPLCGSGLGEGEMVDQFADIIPITVQKLVSDSLTIRWNFLRHELLQWLIARPNKSNKQMPKASVALKVMRSDTNICLLLIYTY